MTPREQIRAQLLAAAVELVPERGWTAVSTRVLAERAGVSPSVVHYHFDSMPALLNEAVGTAMAGVVDEVTAALDAASSPEEFVETLVASISRYSGSDPASLLFVEAYLAATRDETLRGTIHQMLDGVRDRFAAWLTRHGVPQPEATAAVLAATLDGILLHRGLGAGNGPDETGEILRRLVRA